jgi:hypothetical protein
VVKYPAVPLTVYSRRLATSSGLRPIRSAASPDSGAVTATASDVMVIASRTSSGEP